MLCFLSILFFIGVISLTISLQLLIVAKRKFFLYLKQITEKGEITKEIGFLEAIFDSFDIFFVFDVFLHIPTEIEQPDIYNNQLLKKQKEKINVLTKVATYGGLLLGLGITGIIICDNFLKVK